MKKHNEQPQWPIILALFAPLLFPVYSLSYGALQTQAGHLRSDGWFLLMSVFFHWIAVRSRRWHSGKTDLWHLPGIYEWAPSHTANYGLRADTGSSVFLEFTPPPHNTYVALHFIIFIDWFILLCILCSLDMTPSSKGLKFLLAKSYVQICSKGPSSISPVLWVLTIFFYISSNPVLSIHCTLAVSVV